MDSVGGIESPKPERPTAPVALDFPAGDVNAASSAAKIPNRIRRRMVETAGKSGSQPSMEKIEAKLREADLRRQQFHEWLSSKARSKPRTSSWSYQEEDLSHRLEARLVAAEQKRLSLLEKAQMRLAKLDELRQAAKSDLENRYEKEREELETRVEFRVQNAEANRMHLLKAGLQRRAAAEERKARSLSQRAIREKKYRECVRTAIFQRRAAAEKKRMGLLEAEKKRANARVVKAFRVAKTVCHQRETERMRLKELLENKLQKAKRQRAEYLNQRRNPCSSTRKRWIKHGELLSRKLARCWRRFTKSKRTTFTLAQEYDAIGINGRSVKSMPFEQLAILVESASTIEATESLLVRLEHCFSILISSSSSYMNNLDHLLKRFATPVRRMPPTQAAMIKGATRKGSMRESRSSRAVKLLRYPVRIVLCAYMILGHPSAVFSDQGECVVALKESAVNFVREFELLIRIILGHPHNGFLTRRSTPDAMSHDSNQHESSSADIPPQKTFRCQLSDFDAAWHSYLFQFLVWKTKDEKSLEEDLLRAACQLELSVMKICKFTSSGQSSDLSPDMKAIQKQVSEDQKLLRQKVLYLSGDAGIKRMECALSDTRSKYFREMESSNPITPVVHISSASASKPFQKPLVTGVHMPHSLTPNSLASAFVGETCVNNGISNNMVYSSFKSESSSPSISGTPVENADAQSNFAVETKPLPSDNELLVNEILHESHDALTAMDADETEVKAMVKQIMEKAFWDGVLDSIKEGEPDYGRIVGLVKEIRDELCELAPSWKQEILDSIDLDDLSQVLGSGILDVDCLWRILHYMLAMLQKLSASATENEMKNSHQKLLEELREVSLSQNKSLAIIKGLRFVSEEVQKLKREISKARIELMKPIIKGSAGLEYLQKAFSDRYGEPSTARRNLPLTFQWISSFRNNLEEEWNDHIDSCSVLTENHGLPPITALRSGGGLLVATRQGTNEFQECKGEDVDKLVRLGLLKLASVIEGTTTDTVPETLKLNALRLRSVQSQLQQIIVIATSALILRQMLLSEKSDVSLSELDSITFYAVKELSELLNRVPDAGINEITQTLINSCSLKCSFLSTETMPHRRMEMITRMLMKSLQSNNAIFKMVSRSIYVAARGLVLGGTGDIGRKLADAALRRIGATMVLERVVKLSGMLITMASITSRVHGPWYKQLS